MIDNYLGRTTTFSEYLASSFDQELIAAIRRHRRILLRLRHKTEDLPVLGMMRANTLCRERQKTPAR